MDGNNPPKPATHTLPTEDRDFIIKFCQVNKCRLVGEFLDDPSLANNPEMSPDLINVLVEQMKANRRSLKNTGAPQPAQLVPVPQAPPPIPKPLPALPAPPAPPEPQNPFNNPMLMHQFAQFLQQQQQFQMGPPVLPQMPQFPGIPSPDPLQLLQQSYLAQMSHFPPQIPPQLLAPSTSGPSAPDSAPPKRQRAPKKRPTSTFWNNSQNQPPMSPQKLAKRLGEELGNIYKCSSKCPKTENDIPYPFDRVKNLSEINMKIVLEVVRKYADLNEEVANKFFKEVLIASSTGAVVNLFSMALQFFTDHKQKQVEAVKKIMEEQEALQDSEKAKREAAQAAPPAQVPFPALQGIRTVEEIREYAVNLFALERTNGEMDQQHRNILKNPNIRRYLQHVVETQPPPQPNPNPPSAFSTVEHLLSQPVEQDAPEQLPPLNPDVVMENEPEPESNSHEIDVEMVEEAPSDPIIEEVRIEDDSSPVRRPPRRSVLCENLENIINTVNNQVQALSATQNTDPIGEKLDDLIDVEALENPVEEENRKPDGALHEQSLKMLKGIEDHFGAHENKKRRIEEAQNKIEVIELDDSDEVEVELGSGEEVEGEEEEEDGFTDAAAFLAQFDPDSPTCFKRPRSPRPQNGLETLAWLGDVVAQMEGV